jgi:hypothetical protein
MDEIQIVNAINNAQKGISQYLEIMELFPNVDVSTNRDFQRKFNGFYRIIKRPESWYREYYSSMQRWKGSKPTFDEVLEHLNKSLGKYEPSFSSKLVATLDPNQPIWDAYVLENTQIKVPSYTSCHKLERAQAAYKCLQSWYKLFLG